jgi:citrate lyase synthetase
MSNLDLTPPPSTEAGTIVDATKHRLETFCWLYREDDALIATGGADHLIRIISVANSQEIKTLEGHKSKLLVKRDAITTLLIKQCYV